MSTFPPPPPAPLVGAPPSSTFFSIEYLCTRTSLVMCNGTSYTYIPSSSSCLPPVLNSGSLSIQEPSLSVMGLVTAGTAAYSAYRIARHVKAVASGNEYAAHYGLMSASLLTLVLTRTLAFDAGILTSILVGVTSVLSGWTTIALLMAGLSDVNLLPITHKARILASLPLVLVHAIMLGLGFLAQMWPLLFAGYYALPWSCAIGYVATQIWIVYHLEHHRQKAGIWLSLAVIVFLVACVSATAASELLCAAFTANFDGTFFFYLLLDVASSLLYRYLQATKVGLDPDILAMVRRHRDIARMAEQLDEDERENGVDQDVLID